MWIWIWFDVLLIEPYKHQSVVVWLASCNSKPLESMGVLVPGITHLIDVKIDLRCNQSKGTVQYGPLQTLVNAITYVRGFYGGTLASICYSFILSLNQIHFDVYLIIENPSTTKSVH